MRLVQIRVPDDVLDGVLDTLDDANADYAIADGGADSEASLVYFPLPDGAVETMLDRLSENGLDDDVFTVVSQIETATTPHFDELEGRYTQGPEEEIGLSHAELRTKAQELTPETPMFVTFAALSAIVATAGLLLNSAIVIVGAMVISPFAGSSLSASVGAVIGDYDSIFESFRSQLLGIGVAIGSATVAGLVFRWGFFTPPVLAVGNIDVVSSFSTPTLLTLTIAIAAGAAGALALATDLPVAIAGVAVAAAIVPAAAAVGLGIVWRQPLLGLGALAVLLMNMVFINITAFLALWSIGYRSSSNTTIVESIQLDHRTIIYTIGAVAVVFLLVVLAASTYQYFLFGRTVNHNVNDVLSQPSYASLELVHAQTDYGGGTIVDGSNNTSVTIIVRRPSNETYPHLSGALQRQITADTNRPVAVSVQFIDYQRTSSAGQKEERGMPLNDFSEHASRRAYTP